MMMNNPAIQIGENKVYSGHNLDILRTFNDNSIDSIVTDPPYELGFMGKSWDNSGIAYNVELWQECLRVLKPGGHLLAFGGSRTWHRLAVAIEDAGFEMRDSIAWIYGSGFPKSHNISKAIDKLQGAERTVIGNQLRPDGSFRKNTTKNKGSSFDSGSNDKMITAPATDDAKKWDGWGTALKPAFEPIVVARKPLIGTVAENVLQFGVGGLNIDATRIAGEVPSVPMAEWTQSGTTGASAKRSGEMSQPSMLGRWPANVILDETTAKLLDEQSGISKSASIVHEHNTISEGYNYKTKSIQAYADSGGASRFFYVAKASKRDRNEGLDELPEVRHADRNATDGVGGDNPRNRTNKAKQNFHPTVKPTTLMTYLIKLVTPPTGLVLDPFAGSGSTGKAAILEGYKFVGIELTEDYLPIIEGRLQHAYQTYLDKGDDLFA